MKDFKNLDQLADQLYQEGMGKAQQESEKVLEEARVKAEEKINAANKKAEDIVAKARKEAEKYRSSVESEVNQKANQVKQDLKNQIKGLINTELLSSPSKAILSKEDFVQALILSALETWKDGKQDLELTIAEKLKEIEPELRTAILQRLPGLTITISDHMDNGFKIEDHEKGYMLSFTDSDFKALFEPYLTDFVRDVLFGSGQ